MFFKVVDCGLYKSIEIGKDKISISHLQFADDTLFMGKATVENVILLKRLLANLELVSGLKVNKGKCNIYGVNVEMEQVENFANILECRMGQFSFTYLGVQRKMGDGKDTLFWEDIWVEGVQLRERFPRLYRLSLEKGGRWLVMGVGMREDGIRSGDGDGYCLIGNYLC
ncbi:hypothetical protein ACS0TY_026399 [Phlomoides rotata]